MKVRGIRSLSDVRGVVRLYRRVWKNSFGIVDLLAEASTGLILEDEAGGVAGYAFVEEDRRRGFAEVVDIAVSAVHRGRGHGRRLLAALQARYPALKLVARSDSPGLLRFYRRLGFAEEGRFQNYYAAGRDGVRLAWSRRTGAAPAPRGGRSRPSARDGRSRPSARDGRSRPSQGDQRLSKK